MHLLRKSCVNERTGGLRAAAILAVIHLNE